MVDSLSYLDNLLPLANDWSYISLVVKQRNCTYLIMGYNLHGVAERLPKTKPAQSN